MGVRGWLAKVGMSKSSYNFMFSSDIESSGEVRAGLGMFAEVNNSSYKSGGTFYVSRIIQSSGGQGTYLVSVPVPKGVTIQNVRLSNEILWDNLGSAYGHVYDSGSALGYFSSIDLKTVPPVHAVFTGAGGYSFMDQSSLASSYAGLTVNVSSSGHIVYFKVITNGAGSTGRSRVDVTYSYNVTTSSYTTFTSS